MKRMFGKTRLHVFRVRPVNDMIESLICRGRTKLPGYLPRRYGNVKNRETACDMGIFDPSNCLPVSVGPYLSFWWHFMTPEWPCAAW